MDPILFWNDVANQANAKTHTSPTSEDPAENGSRGPCGSSRAYAIVHLAMHDAYFAIDGGHPTWLGQLPPVPANADADVAVAGAAHHALKELYTAQKADIDAQLAPGLDQASLNFGVAVAAAVLAARQNDATTSGAGHNSSDARGRHRPAPDSPMQGYHAPMYGARTGCFAATHRYKLNPPPPRGSGDYERAVAE